MTSVCVAACVVAEPVAVIATGYLPGTALPDALNCAMDEPPLMNEGGLKVAVTPEGRPATDMLSIWLLPVTVVATVA